MTATTAGGASDTSSADQYNYVPVVTGVSPDSGNGGGGDTVTITGVGFGGATEVDFGQGDPVLAANFISSSDTQIVVSSPAGAGVVDVTVVTPDGTSCNSPADQFTYPGDQSPDVVGEAGDTGNPTSPANRRMLPTRALAGSTCRCSGILLRFFPGREPAESPDFLAFGRQQLEHLAQFFRPQVQHRLADISGELWPRTGGHQRLARRKTERQPFATDYVQLQREHGIRLPGLGGHPVRGDQRHAELVLFLDLRRRHAQRRPDFFIQSSASALTATFNASASLTGDLAIGDLANVNATATATAGVSATFGFQTFAGDADGNHDNKLRISDLTNNLSRALTASLNIPVSIKANLSAQVSMLPNISWSPSFSGTFNTSGFQNLVVNLNPPTPASLLSGVVTGFFNLGTASPAWEPWTTT